MGGGGRKGRGACMTGTFMTGNLRLLDLTFNSTCRPGGYSNPTGKISVAVNERPADTSLICGSTPGALTVGSDNTRGFVLLFWMVTELVTAFDRGPAATVM